MIGIFDSGSGGLTVLKELRKRAPNADIVYFGDLKNAPYGNRSREELGVLTALGIQKLIENGATEIISACNSVSVSITKPLLDILDFPVNNIIEMVGPTVQDFRDKDIKVLLVATKATIESGVYQAGFNSGGIDATCVSIPELVSFIEGGANIYDVEELVTTTLKKYLDKKCTHVVLGCTHFPLVRNIFEKVLEHLGGSMVVIDPAVSVAKKAVKNFNVEGDGYLRVLTSKRSTVFEEFLERIEGGVKCEIG